MKILETFYSAISYILTRTFGLLELILFLRLAVKYFGGNPETPAVNFVYKITEPFVAPFNQIFPGVVWPPNKPLDMTTLSAMVGYSFLFFIILQLLRSLAKD